MKHRIAVTLSVFALALAVSDRATAAPPAPTALAPANGANVTIPFTISWSAVSDPSGIVAYNWQVSPSSSFASVVLQNSTSGPTQDTVSGLATGSYFWRVQAVSGAFVQGAWSQPRSFTVTGAGSGAPGTTTLGPPKGYSTFHPYEVMTFNWTAVPGATSYLLQASTDPNFPVLTRIQFDNIPNTTYSFAIGNPEGNYWARVLAVNASGIVGQPSNLITFSVFFNNPVPPAPSPLTPADGATLTLPITLTWTESPNPQPSGYDLQIARDSGFQSIEALDSQLNNPSRTELSLTPGTKFWRVHSVQGNSSPTTAAVTAWSTTRTFTVSSAPPKPVSVSFTTNPLTSGDSTWVQLQLTTAAPASGATINLTSSNPTAAPVPATISMPPNIAWTQFMMQAGQVGSPTPVTITATLNGASASGQLTVQPTALKSLSISPSTISGGAQAGAIVMLTGQSPPGGAAVSLSSNSPAVNPPASVFVNPGDFSVSFPLQTNSVAANTTATVTASWNGVSTQAQVTLTPQQAPASLTLDPTSTIGTSGSSFGTVAVASPPSSDLTLQVTSSHPTIAQVPNSVIVPAGVTRGGFNIFTTRVTTQTLVTISVSGGGVTKTAILTVNPDGTPPPAATLSSFTVNPTSVVGGNPATGTVTLPSAAPAGGAVVTLTSNQPGAASVPASVTVPAGATSANFTITTFPSAGTTVQLSASLGNTTLFAALGVNPAPPSSPTLSAVSVNPTTVVGGNSSTGTVTLSAAAPSGGAVVSLSDDSTAAATPANVTVPAGATTANFTITTTSVTASTAATISAAFAGVTRTVSLTVNPAAPPPSGLPAPSQLSPAADAVFSSGRSITFDWSDVAGAANYTIQIDDSSSFSAPFTVNQTTAISQFTTTTLPTTRMWWRVRANDASGAPGAWSPGRRFEVE